MLLVFQPSGPTPLSKAIIHSFQTLYTTNSPQLCIISPVYSSLNSLSILEIFHSNFYSILTYSFFRKIIIHFRIFITINIDCKLLYSIHFIKIIKILIPSLSYIVFSYCQHPRSIFYSLAAFHPSTTYPLPTRTDFHSKYPFMQPHISPLQLYPHHSTTPSLGSSSHAYRVIHFSFTPILSPPHLIPQLLDITEFIQF